MTMPERINLIRDEFLNDPLNISEKKINILKNYYFIWAKGIIEIHDISLFRIGVNKNKNILWFNNINKPNIHLLLNIQENKYQIIEKTFNKQQIEESIDIPSLVDSTVSVKRKEKINLIDESKVNCYKRCRIL
jgi:hypothetical protein